MYEHVVTYQQKKRISVQCEKFNAIADKWDVRNYVRGALDKEAPHAVRDLT